MKLFNSVLLASVLIFTGMSSDSLCKAQSKDEKVQKKAQQIKKFERVEKSGDKTVFNRNFGARREALLKKMQEDPAFKESLEKRMAQRKKLCEKMDAFRKEMKEKREAIRKEMMENNENCPMLFRGNRPNFKHQGPGRKMMMKKTKRTAPSFHKGQPGEGAPQALKDHQRKVAPYTRRQQPNKNAPSDLKRPQKRMSPSSHKGQPGESASSAARPDKKMERQDTELRKHLNRVMVIRQKKDGEDQEDNIKQVKVQAFRVRRRPEENKGDRVWVDLRNAGPIESFGSESRNIRHLRERLKFIRSLRKE